MPRYDVVCEWCGKETEVWVRIDERDNIACPACGRPARRRAVYRFAAHIWKPQWFEHIDTKPIYIESKKQLREECKKRGLIPLGLE